MAPVEIDTIPMDIMAPVKYMKVVDKAFELPFITSVYDEITKMAAPITPYVENSMTTITPMVEIGYNTIKAKVEENVMPHLPDGMSESVQANISSAVDHMTAAVEKIDTLACGGLDQLTENVPALKGETPELLDNSKETATSYFTLATNYMASFSLAQVALKVVDSGLDLVEGAVLLTGAKVSDLEQEISNYSIIIDEKNNNYYRDIHNAHTETLLLKQEVIQNKEALTSKDETLQVAISEKNELEEQFSIKDKQVSDIERCLKALNKELVKQKAENNSLKASLNLKSSENVVKLTEERKSLMKKISELENHKSAKATKSKTDELQNEIIRLKTSNREMQLKLSESINKNAQLEIQNVRTMLQNKNLAELVKKASSKPGEAMEVDDIEEEVEVTKAEKESDIPLFKVLPKLIAPEDQEVLSCYSKTELGEDPSSKYFMPRQKSIGFVMWVDGEFFALQQNFFLQNTKYNDFSGGYKRFYKTLPDWLIQDHMKEALTEFAQLFKLPNYACILVQLQKSTISSSMNDAKFDFTGQGVHTDGSERAMLICVDRENVLGGNNLLFEDIKGKNTILPKTVLDRGDSLFFMDNQMHHFVSDAKPKDSAKDMVRTMLIAHYPGHYFLFGKENPNNQLLRGESSQKLRNESNPNKTQILGGKISKSFQENMKANSSKECEP